MKNYFLAGLIILLPLVITYWIVTFLIRIVTGPFENLASYILTSVGVDPTGIILSILNTLLILTALTLFILLIGVIGSHIIVRSLLHVIDRALHKLPFINKVYLSCKDF